LYNETTVKQKMHSCVGRWT